MRRYLFALILGLGGIAILLSLGSWQLRRMEWKAGIIAAIEGKIAADPQALATLAAPRPDRDQYQPVTLAGTTGADLLVLSGQKAVGPGYEVVTAFTTDDGRTVLLDRGFIAEADRDIPRPATRLTVTGNLLWPDDADSYTPPPDLEKRLWFARNVETMSDFLHAAPILVVARMAQGQQDTIVPVPVDTAGIPNDHLEYALTWFALAGVWGGMTAYLIWRIRRRTN